MMTPTTPKGRVKMTMMSKSFHIGNSRARLLLFSKMHFNFPTSFLCLSFVFLIMFVLKALFLLSCLFFAYGDALNSWDFPGKAFDPYVKYVCFLPKQKVMQTFLSKKKKKGHANMLIPKNNVGEKKNY